MSRPTFLAYFILICLLVFNNAAPESTLMPEEATAIVQENPADNNTASSTANLEVSTSTVVQTTSDASAKKVRMVTKEELEMHDGKKSKTLWVSIMSQVFDVTAGPEYYSEEAPYSIFVGRDGNVPFITGNFTPEEAARPLTELEDHQLMGLLQWLEFYVNEDKYPFVGYLEGDLYDKDGNPTEMLKSVQDSIYWAKAKTEERRKKSAKLMAKRMKEEEERKKAKRSKKSSFSPGRDLLSFISSLFHRGNDNSKEL